MQSLFPRTAVLVAASFLASTALAQEATEAAENTNKAAGVGSKAEAPAKAGGVGSKAEAPAKAGGVGSKVEAPAKAGGVGAKVESAAAPAEAPAAVEAPAAEAQQEAPAQPAKWTPESRWPAMHIGLSAGGHLVITDWGAAVVDEKSGLYVSPDSGLIARLRLGAQFTDVIGIEISGAWLPISAADKDVYALAYDAGLQLFFSTGTWRPFFSIGGGVYHFPKGEKRVELDNGAVAIDDVRDFDPLFYYGFGLRAMATDWFAGRLDMRHIFSDGLKPEGPAIGSNLELSIGVDFIFGGAEPAPAPDTDGDGVPDHEDKCPNEAGPIENNGCPVVLDRDGDGVLDADDLCPDEPGPASTKGCPDRDGDGVADKDDKCPDKAGPASMQGCPDRDGDGIADHEDECPDEKGTAELKGCADDDGDGVPNHKDKCPKLAGPADMQGCPPPTVEVTKQFSGSIEGINFETGSAKLTDDSKPVIEKAASVLKEYGNLRIRVEGHTDNVGKKASNQKLSEERASSVRSALISAGIAGDRIEAEGFGQEKPAASNKNAKGRAKNRRIEFKIIQ